MSWVTAHLPAILGVVALLGSLTALLLVLFFRATRGTKGLRARVERLFLLPVRVRPLPKGHYFKAYWQG